MTGVTNISIQDPVDRWDAKGVNKNREHSLKFDVFVTFNENFKNFQNLKYLIFETPCSHKSIRGAEFPVLDTMPRTQTNIK